jgi:hypothetical protein
MTPIERDDLERDAWLREALRHAPDADAAPPATLSAAILKQARAATATATASAPRSASLWSAAWAWLARPPVAASFASVMAATLVGLIWWDRPMDEAMPQPPAPGLQRSAPAEAPAPAAASGQAAPAARAEAPNDVRLEAQGAAAAARPAPPAPPARKAAPDAARRPAPVATAKPPSAAQRPEPEPFASERKQASGAPAPAPATAATPARSAPAMAETAKDAAPPRQRATTGAAQESRRLTRDEPEAASAATSRNPAAGVLNAAPSPPAMTALRLRQDEATDRTAPLADTLASITNSTGLWSWQRGAGTQEMTPALQRWLMQLDAATASRWRAPPAAAAGAKGSVLHLYRAGEPRATLSLDDDGVSFTPPGATTATLRAPLAPAAAAALKRGLEDAAP